MSLFEIDIGTPVLFAHIPKTGGSSIRTGRQNGICRLYEPDEEWTNLPSFAFVRDPFDRIESCWRDFRYLRPRTALEFEAFVEYVNRSGVDALIDSPSTIEHHAAPMTHPVHGLKHAEFVGRFEKLQTGLNMFCTLLDQPFITLPQLRNGNGLPEAPSTKSARRLVERYYEKDYEFLGTRSLNCEMATSKGGT